MTEQESESTGLTSEHQRRLAELEGYIQDNDSRLEALLAPPEPNGSFNVISQGTEHANNASTYRQDARPASDNSGRRGGASLRNSKSSETGGDSKRNGSFQSFIESKSLIENIGILLLGLATSLYSLVVTAASTLFGSRKVTASTTETQRMVDILDGNGLTGSKVVIEDPQLSNLSDLVLIQHYPYENGERKALIDGQSKDRIESSVSFKEILSLIPRILFTAGLEIH
ncbi:predicted protein [Chaetoceros tenuissimus]|uniref:Uncharacterized protein n=1 Tax=Chaetoceros tenuissimus TaxID=426638 RepID=A0AAD3CVT1_9STRA|nr:predicted protein [Chaetoceros tenuissimus]